MEGNYEHGKRTGGTLLQADGKTFHASFTAGRVCALKSEGPDGVAIEHDGKPQQAQSAASPADESSAEWKEGTGCIKYGSGDSYTGGFSKNMRHGTGVMAYSNGDIYEGSWADDMRHGKGRMTWHTAAPPPVSGWRYEGDWRDDKPNGHGVLLVDLEGNKYEGCWVHGRRSGLGVEVQAEYTYEGAFRDNARDGQGKLTAKDGTVYKGIFENGQLHDPAARIVFGNGDVYTGEVSAGEIEGEGVIEYANGDRYEGEMKCNMRSGSGILTWADGSRYEGMWRDDKMQGHGLRVYKGTAAYEGTFRDNEKHGRGTWLEFGSGNRYNVTFDKNEVKEKHLVSRGEAGRTRGSKLVVALASAPQGTSKTELHVEAFRLSPDFGLSAAEKRRVGKPYCLSPDKVYAVYSQGPEPAFGLKVFNRATGTEVDDGDDILDWEILTAPVHIAVAENTRGEAPFIAWASVDGSYVGTSTNWKKWTRHEVPKGDEAATAAFDAAKLLLQNAKATHAAAAADVAAKAAAAAAAREAVNNDTTDANKNARQAATAELNQAQTSLKTAQNVRKERTVARNRVEWRKVNKLFNCRKQIASLHAVQVSSGRWRIYYTSHETGCCSESSRGCRSAGGG
ncbi:Phosphatidylinositol 4-phosphate 5-kinase 2 [Diplonema papillatum]|nr:Phosphatidylinositol 4-phosphate 5-kinase 2 [Diplonema papillatum]